MLRHLDIRDLLIIDRLELAFQPGLNVLTGETGAGKSILLDALGFVLGWRGRADLVRAGASQGEVVAVFELAADHPPMACWRRRAAGGRELILRRVNAADGRKTAWVNDRRASGEVLRACRTCWWNCTGNRTTAGFWTRATTGRCWTISAGSGRCAPPSPRPGRSGRSTLKALEAAEARLEEMRREEEFLRHAAAEIAALAPRQGEEAELDARRRLMQAAEKMRADVARAAAALSPDGAEGQLGDARRWLDGLTDRADGGLDGALAALERAMVELGEAQSEVAGFADRLVFNPAELEEAEERLFALRGLARKHGIVVDDLERFGADLEARVAALDGGAEEIAGLRAAHKDAVAAWRDAADRLSHARAEAARRLDAPWRASWRR
jgi:DNA repair protein RecN (Recombination protein N)